MLLLLPGDVERAKSGGLSFTNMRVARPYKSRVLGKKTSTVKKSCALATPLLLALAQIDFDVRFRYTVRREHLCDERVVRSCVRSRQRRESLSGCEGQRSRGAADTVLVAAEHSPWHMISTLGV